MTYTLDPKYHAFLLQPGKDFVSKFNELHPAHHIDFVVKHRKLVDILTGALTRPLTEEDGFIHYQIFGGNPETMKFKDEHPNEFRKALAETLKHLYPNDYDKKMGFDKTDFGNVKNITFTTIYKNYCISDVMLHDDGGLVSNPWAGNEVQGFADWEDYLKKGIISVYTIDYAFMQAFPENNIEYEVPPIDAQKDLAYIFDELNTEILTKRKTLDAKSAAVINTYLISADERVRKERLLTLANVMNRRFRKKYENSIESSKILNLILDHVIHIQKNENNVEHGKDETQSVLSFSSASSNYGSETSTESAQKIEEERLKRRVEELELMVKRKNIFLSETKEYVESLENKYVSAIEDKEKWATLAQRQGKRISELSSVIIQNQKNLGVLSLDKVVQRRVNKFLNKKIQSLEASQNTANSNQLEENEKLKKVIDELKLENQRVKQAAERQVQEKIDEMNLANGNAARERDALATRILQLEIELMKSKGGKVADGLPSQSNQTVVPEHDSEKLKLEETIVKLNAEIERLKYSLEEEANTSHELIAKNEQTVSALHGIINKQKSELSEKESEIKQLSNTVKLLKEAKAAGRQSKVETREKGIGTHPEKEEGTSTSSPVEINVETPDSGIVDLSGQSDDTDTHSQNSGSAESPHSSTPPTQPIIPSKNIEESSVAPKCFREMKKDNLIDKSAYKYIIHVLIQQATQRNQIIIGDDKWKEFRLKYKEFSEEKRIALTEAESLFADGFRLDEMFVIDAMISKDFSDVKNDIEDHLMSAISRQFRYLLSIDEKIEGEEILNKLALISARFKLLIDSNYAKFFIGESRRVELSAKVDKFLKEMEAHKETLIDFLGSTKIYYKILEKHSDSVIKFINYCNKFKEVTPKSIDKFFKKEKGSKDKMKKDLQPMLDEPATDSTYHALKLYYLGLDDPQFGFQKFLDSYCELEHFLVPKKKATKEFKSIAKEESFNPDSWVLVACLRDVLQKNITDPNFNKSVESSDENAFAELMMDDNFSIFLSVLKLTEGYLEKAPVNSEEDLIKDVVLLTKMLDEFINNKTLSYDHRIKLLDYISTHRLITSSFSDVDAALNKLIDFISFYKSFLCSDFMKDVQSTPSLLLRNNMAQLTLDYIQTNKLALADKIVEQSKKAVTHTGEQVEFATMAQEVQAFTDALEDNRIDTKTLLFLFNHRHKNDPNAPSLDTIVTTLQNNKVISTTHELYKKVCGDKKPK